MRVVSYANTSADVTDHVGFGVDSPLIEDFFFFSAVVLCVGGFVRTLRFPTFYRLDTLLLPNVPSRAPGAAEALECLPCS